ncbi:MAG: DUF4065 domain-containing protein [Defluviitaleaceae bacterium]|nr:DUF4065 domain-containing protein [Defluviitaleaceae bacterium]
MINKIIDFFCCLKYNKVEHSFNYRGGVYMLNALHVSNNLINRAMADNIHMSPMKLQKLVYFVYKRYLQETKKPLFSERFATWKYGPVQENVYNEFKEFGANDITRRYAEVNGNILIVKESNEKVKEAFNFVWNKYKNYNGTQLSILTHKDGTAWKYAYDNNKAYLEDEQILIEGWLE